VILKTITRGAQFFISSIDKFKLATALTTDTRVPKNYCERNWLSRNNNEKVELNDKNQIMIFTNNGKPTFLVCLY
jgi:hypothetical protein